MKILMVLEKEFPQDERVEKEIRSFLNEGHEVRIATYSTGGRPSREEYEGYLIYRKRIGKLMYKLGAAILVLPFYFRWWRIYLRSIYREWTFEAMHIHDLPLAKLGAEFNSRHGVRFVADQHEYYSSWIVQTAHYNTRLGKLVKALSNWEAYERRYLQRADLVCTVEPPLKELYVKERRLQPGKVITVPNTPLKSIYNVPARERKDPYFSLYYCGGLDVLRGLDTAIRALPFLKDRVPGIRLILTGRRNKHFDPAGLARELGVEDLVVFREWVDFRELPHEIDLGDVCFFTPPVNRDEIHNTIATKIYQYMARAKPVIVGSARYMKEFVERLEIGIVIDEKDPADFAGAVVRLHSDRSLRDRLSANAFRHMESFYWEKTVRKLLDFYAAPPSHS